MKMRNATMRPHLFTKKVQSYVLEMDPIVDAPPFWKAIGFSTWKLCDG